jgi:hypothetical protein
LATAQCVEAIEAAFYDFCEREEGTARNRTQLFMIRHWNKIAKTLKRKEKFIF